MGCSFTYIANSWFRQFALLGYFFFATFDQSVAWRFWYVQCLHQHIPRQTSACGSTGAIGERSEADQFHWTSFDSSQWYISWWYSLDQIWSCCNDIPFGAACRIWPLQDHSEGESSRKRKGMEGLWRFETPRWSSYVFRLSSQQCDLDLDEKVFHRKPLKTGVACFSSFCSNLFTAFSNAAGDHASLGLNKTGIRRQHMTCAASLVVGVLSPPLKRCLRWLTRFLVMPLVATWWRPHTFLKLRGDGRFLFQHLLSLVFHCLLAMPLWSKCHHASMRDLVSL